MNSIRLMAATACAAAFCDGIPAAALAEDPPPEAAAPIVALGLYKNGTVTVTRWVEPPAGGVFFLPGTVRHAHGTLWADTREPLKIRTRKRPVSTPGAQTNPWADLAAAYEGRRVTLSLRAPVGSLLQKAADEKARTLYIARESGTEVEDLAGTVVGIASGTAARAWSREYVLDEPLGSRRLSSTMPWADLRGVVPADGDAARDSGHLHLRTEGGIMVRVPTGIIDGIRSDGINTRAPALVDGLRVEGATRPFRLSYMAQGASWAPSYRIELLDATRMRLALAAIVRNELEAFRNAEVNLISGFPNIEFARVEGLMSPGATLASFFRGLSSKGSERGGGPVVMQQAIMFNTLDPAGADGGLPFLDVAEAGASSDIHYRAIGKLTMDAGESLYLPLAEAETDYERVVDWTVTDRRDGHGGLQRREERQDELWDVVQFANPLESPMTTAPVAVAEDGRILGQSTMFWSNPGQRTSARITQALSVSGNCTETDSGERRERVQIGGDSYDNPVVNGMMRVRNFRGTDVKLIVNLGFSGEFISAATEPDERRVLGSSVFSVNKRQQMRWTLLLKPGEERTLAYQYSVLVRR